MTAIKRTIIPPQPVVFIYTLHPSYPCPLLLQLLNYFLIQILSFLPRLKKEEEQGTSWHFQTSNMGFTKFLQVNRLGESNTSHSDHC